ncbi:MAG: SEC-C metal-binding domain-containing protein [Oscillospiraceae bacterium]|nr:SEC-C metal-binding domain-containing protein [Oscillospiraceae bacterium]
MFYQMKIVRKNTRPSTWRRMLIPAEITFSQLALVMETALEYDLSDQYEFDFFRNYRISEISENSLFRDKFYYTYIYAPDVYTKDILMSEKRFSFRILNSDLPEYAVEVEKYIEGVSCKEFGEIHFPVIIKEICSNFEQIWRSTDETNEILIKKFTTVKGNPEYHGLFQLADKNTGLVISEKAKSVFDRTEYSNKNGLQEAARQFKNLVRNNNLDNLRVADALSFFTAEHLREFAEEDEFVFSSSSTDEMAEEYGEYILREDIMKKRLLNLDYEEFTKFSEACEKEIFVMSKEEKEVLEASVLLNYFVFYQNNMGRVPEDAAVVFRKIQSEGYTDYYMKAKWLEKCFVYAAITYGVTTLKTVYRIFSKNKCFNSDYSEFTQLTGSLPDVLNHCIITGDTVISKNCFESNAHDRIMKLQIPGNYYIPEYEEVRMIAENGWPSDEIAYQQIRNFFRNEFSTDDETIHFIMMNIFQLMSASVVETEIVKCVSSEFKLNISVNKRKKLLELLKKALTETRNVFLKGFKPSEYCAKSSSKGYVSDEFKFVLDEESKREFEQIFWSERETVNKSGTVKITPDDRVRPNSPCPCGSGKKYKKCCAMKSI